MDNNNFNPNQETTKPFLKREEESLEISSTGYGLESVAKETGKGRTNQQTMGTNPSCGGL